MNYVLKLDTNGDVTKVGFPEEHDFRWYSKQIGCEWIEIVRPRGYQYVLVIDEEGKLKENKVNPIASVMYGILEHGEPIVGTALLMKEDFIDGELDLVGLSEEESDLVMSRIKEFVL